MKPNEELTEMLSQLAGSLRDDQLEDPQLITMLTQLVMVLEPEADRLPQEIIEQLKTVADKKQMFVTAAEMMGAFDQNSLKQLADQLKASGLLEEH